MSAFSECALVSNQLIGYGPCLLFVVTECLPFGHNQSADWDLLVTDLTPLVTTLVFPLGYDVSDPADTS